MNPIPKGETHLIVLSLNDDNQRISRSRGFGFIEMSTKEEGAAAIEKFNARNLADGR